MKKLLFLALLFFSGPLYAQVDTTYVYMDRFYNPVKGWENAELFYKAYKQDSTKYILSLHDRTTQILRKETYLDADFTIRNGQYVNYQNGKPVLKGVYLNSEREGIFVRYDTSGRVLETKSYVKNVLDGPCALYWPNGIIKEAGNYKNGQKIGEWIAHYENDSLAIKEVFDENNKLIDSIYLDEQGRTTQKLKVMTPAIFPGEMESFYRFIGRNLKFPEELMWREINGIVFVSFTINATGKLTDIEIETSSHASLSKEVIRTLEKSPNWIPATFLGKKIDFKSNIPVKFTLR